MNIKYPIIYKGKTTINQVDRKAKLKCNVLMDDCAESDPLICDHEVHVSILTAIFTNVITPLPTIWLATTQFKYNVENFLELTPIKSFYLVYCIFYLICINSVLHFCSIILDTTRLYKCSINLIYERIWTICRIVHTRNVLYHYTMCKNMYLSST